MFMEYAVIGGVMPRLGEVCCIWREYAAFEGNMPRLEKVCRVLKI